MYYSLIFCFFLINGYLNLNIINLIPLYNIYGMSDCQYIVYLLYMRHLDRNKKLELRLTINIVF